MSDAVVSHLSIINEALAAIGGGAIQSEDEDSALAEKVVKAYYRRIDALLGMHEWTWAGKTFKLGELAQTSDNGFDARDGKFTTGWQHAFEMPGARLSGPRKVMTDPRRPDDPFRDFAVEQDVIYADRTPLWAAFTVRVNPTVWKPDFKLAAVTLVAADFCVPVSHDANMAAVLLEKGQGTPSENGRGGELGRAIASDAASAARSKSAIWHDPLTSARF